MKNKITSGHTSSMFTTLFGRSATTPSPPSILFSCHKPVDLKLINTLLKLTSECQNTLWPSDLKHGGRESHHNTLACIAVPSKSVTNILQYAQQGHTHEMHFYLMHHIPNSTPKGVPTSPAVAAVYIASRAHYRSH